MKRKTAAAVLAAALLCLLTACGVKITGLALPETLALEAGESETLTLEYTTEKETTEEKLAQAAGKLALSWTSSDEAVATVAGDGTVTAVAPGQADITAATEDGTLTASCSVTVGVGVTGVEAPETLELQLGETESAALDAKAAPETATGVAFTYASSDEAVATVDEKGTVTAVGEGECTIAVKAEGFGGTNAESEVKVTVLAEKKVQSTQSSWSGSKGSTGGKSGNTGSAGTVSTGGTGSTQAPAPSAPEGGIGDSAAGGNAGTGVNPNEGGAGSVTDVVPGDGSWAVDGGDATLDEGAVPPPPIETPPPPAPEGGGIGGDLNQTIPGGGTTDGNGGDAEYGGRPVP